jgi:hypothetical protein
MTAPLLSVTDNVVVHGDGVQLEDAPNMNVSGEHKGAQQEEMAIEFREPFFHHWLCHWNQPYSETQMVQLKLRACHHCRHH